MRIPARIACYLYLILSLTACSKKITISAEDMAGYYSQRIYPPYTYTRELEHVEDLLELTTNSRFIYEQFYMQYNGDDVGASRFSWIRTGKFNFYSNKIILHFDRTTDLRNISKYFIRDNNKLDNESFSGLDTDTLRIVNRKRNPKIGKMIKVKDIDSLGDFAPNIYFK